MHILKKALAAAILLGGIAGTAVEVEAMPVQTLTSDTDAQANIQHVYYGYGWRRPFYRRPFYRRPAFGYGYGWRRPFIGRGYYGYGRVGRFGGRSNGRGYAYGHRTGGVQRFIGSRAH